MPPCFITLESQAIVAPETLFEPIKNQLTHHFIEILLNQPCLTTPQFYHKINNDSDEELLSNEYIDNLRYIPISEGNELYAIVVLVNVNFSISTKELIDVTSFISATITLLKNRKQHAKSLSIKPVDGPVQEQNQSIIESLLQHSFHSTFLFNEEFKVLKANAASQQLFNSNVERGWPSIETLIKKSMPSISDKLLTTISKYFFLGHLDKQEWLDVELIQNCYHSVTVDIHLFNINYFGHQCFGLMLNEKTKNDINTQDHDSSLQRFNALTSVAPMAILQVDKQFHCSYVNETWEKYTGQQHVHSLGTGWLSCLSTSNINETLSDITRIITRSKTYKGELQLTTVDQHRLWVSMNAVGIFNNKYELTGVIITLHDISDARDQAEKLQKMANYDHLTGLSNRSFFTDRLSVALSRVHRHGITALMFLDLDRFKSINDALGHPVGDRVIQEVASRLKSTVRDEDSIARLGGDEFAIIFTDVKADNVLMSIASKIVNSINLPFTIDDQSIVLSCSIGIAVADEINVTSTDILRKADLALYNAKESGRNQFRYYDISLEKNTSLLNCLKNDLEGSVIKGFSLVFQPLINANNNDDIIGFEVLSRWSNPAIDNVGPDTFIKVIEDNGLIQKFSEWLFQTVIVQVKLWLDKGLLIKPQKIAVNLSVKQLHLTDFAESLINMFLHENIDPKWFTLEVTETAFMRDPVIAGQNLYKLKDAGFLIALDDFGTGYSSLSLLRQMPLDYIKIDRSFVKDILHDDEAAKIVLAIIGLGNMLKLGTIAEGVENNETKNWLVEQGCFCHQGYYFHKPLLENKASILLTNRSNHINIIEIKPKLGVIK